VFLKSRAEQANDYLMTLIQSAGRIGIGTGRLAELAAEQGWSRAKVQRILVRLHEDGLILRVHGHVAALHPEDEDTTS